MGLGAKGERRDGGARVQPTAGGYLLPQPPARLQLSQQQTRFFGTSSGGGHSVSTGDIMGLHKCVQIEK